MSLWHYLREEVTRGYILDGDEERYTSRRQKMYAFMRIPRELEKFMSYGFFHCLDSFLFVFTFLPIRFFLAAVALLTRPILVTLGLKRGRDRGGGGGGGGSTAAGAAWLNPAEIIDLLKGFLIGICVYVMSYIDTSMMYHIIKSQSVIKLYIFFNMLEVGDRLFSAFGQDTLDALFWTATEPKNRKRQHIGVIPHFLLTMVYVVLHTLLVLVQATTLNVAINASNKALLTIMMSNNFIEIKGSVFKSFNKKNLFQVSCSDVRERFHLFALLFIVVVQTMKEYSWKEESFWSLAPDCFMVLCCEFLVDWIKHAFITRFNEVSAQVYKDYTIHLAYDVALTKQNNAFADQCDAVSRRMGFMPLPLGVVMIRVISTAFGGNSRGAPVVCLMGYLALLSFRMLCSVVILGKACDLIDQHKSRPGQQRKPSVNNPLPTRPAVLEVSPVRQPAQVQNLRPVHNQIRDLTPFRTKAEASQELKAAAVTLEAKIQTMFGQGQTKGHSSTVNNSVSPSCNNDENQDTLVSISQTNQQLAPFSSKLNSKLPPNLHSKPVDATAAAHPHHTSAAAAVGDSEVESNEAAIGSCSRKSSEKWSERRSQLLAARQNFSDSRRRPLSCTPTPSNSTSIDDDDNTTNSAASSSHLPPPSPATTTNSTASSNLPPPSPAPTNSAPIPPSPLAAGRTEEVPIDCEEKRDPNEDCLVVASSVNTSGVEVLKEEVGGEKPVLKVKADNDDDRRTNEVLCQRHQVQNAGGSEPDHNNDIDQPEVTEQRDQRQADSLREKGEREEVRGEGEGAASGFRPKCMSSPDFLKTYRNKSDWPELEALSDEEEEQLISSSSCGNKEDNSCSTAGAAADSGDSPSCSVSRSNSISRRKRCETVSDL